MDDYRDVDEAYVRRCEEIILDAGLKLPPVFTGTSKITTQHLKRVAAYRKENPL